jgi:predicted HTH transcriptional regulator
MKENQDEPEMIAKNISALSNGAALADREHGYIIWGIRDSDRKPVGTEFDPSTKKKGNQDLTLWLRRAISPNIDFTFDTANLEEGRVVVLTVGKAIGNPTEFNGRAYIRVNSNTTPLDGIRQLKKILTDKLEGIIFETGIAKYDLSTADILNF